MVKNPKYRRALITLERREDLGDLDGEMDPVNLKGIVNNPPSDRVDNGTTRDKQKLVNNDLVQRNFEK